MFRVQIPKTLTIFAMFGVLLLSNVQMLILKIKCKEGAVAEWSKALKLIEMINRNQKVPVSPPGQANLL